MGVSLLNGCMNQMYNYIACTFTLIKLVGDAAIDQSITVDEKAM